MKNRKPPKRNKLPREVLQLVEWILREHPNKLDELTMLDKYIEDQCHSVVYEFSGSSGNTLSSAQERILEAKEASKLYQYLVKTIERTEQALSALGEMELKFVECYYWEGISAEYVAYEINRDRRTVFRIRNQALCKMAHILLPDVIYSGLENVT
jgi:DNA-directed RNA polymerase specialized sigma subunit